MSPACCKKALAYNDGPILIHAECVKTDNVFPMIPAGAALEDMITEAPKHQDGQTRRFHVMTCRVSVFRICTNLNIFEIFQLFPCPTPS